MRTALDLAMLVLLGFVSCTPASPSDTPAQSAPDDTTGPAAVAALAASSPPSAAVSASTPAPSASASTAPAGPCPEDMVDVGLACIDRFEAPNKKGEKPILMQSSDDGQKWCEERGKRLCNEDEWVRACKGPKGSRYPYGAKFESGRCNDVGKFIAPSWKTLGSWPSDAAKAEVQKLDQSEASGTREGCVSAEGVFDLTGNVAEWVVRTRENVTNYSHVVKGCFWGRCFRVPHEPECDYVNFAHPAGFRSYEMGIRCCKSKEKTP
ncbi:MAG: SUMF1/EgtB/PvdO family nonheme iron enzyme [Polyangiaceae bacterium]|nr:SUMF1/EgtB/PvdO family nonheme iron enzyme [Polyangiaceae bacterium]